MNNKTKLKRDLKVIGIQQFERASGVYVFLNIVERMAYVGQTTDIDNRLAQHLRGMFLDSDTPLSSGTNVNLREEKNKLFEIAFFPIKWTDNTDILFDYETALMCICREEGCLLYNGDKDHIKEDASPNRTLLISHKLADVDWETCKKENYIKCKDKEDIIYEKMKKDFSNWFTNAYSTSLKNVINLDDNERISIKNVINLDDNERISIWEERVKEFKNPESDFFWIDARGKINAQKELTREDMKKCGIASKSLKELFEEIDSTYSIWSNFGLYITQGPLTILKTKCHDIANFSIERLYGTNSKKFNIKKKDASEKSNDGICFWSLQSWAPKHKRDLLASHNDNIDAYTGPRLLFLPYTSSTAQVEVSAVHLGMEMQQNESLENYLSRINSLKEQLREKKKDDLFAYGYSNGATSKAFPEEMFPMIVSKGSKKMAFLISQMYYVDEIATNNELRKFKNLFTAVFKDPTAKATPLNEANSRQTCFITTIDHIKLNDYVRELSKNDAPEVKLLVAILEYPYIVDICLNEI